ncbi:uroporphyrinogen-III C-methyltransferase [Alteromonas sp. A079]|uniref:uroporphyrinogen-III C-methyltransferase n=1 Tax=Alteromonas sp. A079 TaxID=3410268 RepID=UPI003BA029CD
MNARLHAFSGALHSALFRIQSAFINRDTGIDTSTPSASQSNRKHRGEVFIVGAGPGDAELLTLKAHRLLQTADVVMFDWLVSQSVLDCIPRHISKEFVGKRCGKHSMPQTMICQRLVELGLEGKRVVRLKGGDPAIFARTSEETMALHSAGIKFAIVPGITAASGASAYTGIPLTDRRFAQSVKFMTAQFQNPEKQADWAAIANSVKHETTVVYMGLKRLQQLSEKLINEGIDSAMPVAVIENACCSQQRVVAGTIKSIFKCVAEAEFTGPALVIIGHVVTARQPVALELISQSHAKSTV